MAKAVKTIKKRQLPINAAKNAVKFSSEYQPTPSAKSQGWQEWRKERHLTQSIIKALTGEDGKDFKDYINSLIKNAKAGNPKAIDAINKCLEDEIIKVAQTNTAGEDVNFRILALDPLTLTDDKGNDSTT